MILSADDLNSMQGLVAQQTSGGSTLSSADLDAMAGQANALTRINKIKDQFKNIVAGAMSIAINQPGAQSTIKSQIDHLEKISPSYAASIEGGAEDLLGAKRVAHTLTGNSKAANQDATDLQNMQSDFAQNSSGGLPAEISRLTGKYLPYVAGGPEIDVAKGATFLPKAANFVAKYGSGGAALGAMTANPDQSIGQATVQGALFNMGLAPVGAAVNKLTPAVVSTVRKTLDYLMPGGYTRQLARETSVPSEKIAKAAEQSKSGGLVGQTLQLPHVQKLEENTLTNLPFQTGVSKKVADVAGELNRQAQDVFDTLTNHKSNLENGEELQEKVSNYYEGLQGQKQELYNTFGEIANALGLQVPLKKFKETAKKLRDKYSKGGKQLGVHLDDSHLKILDDIINNPSDFADADIANIYKGELRDIGFDSNDKVKSSIYKQLGKALHADLKDAIDESGNPSLKQAYNESENFYKEKIAPFTEGKLKKLIKSEIDPEMISESFLPKKGRPTLLKSIVDNVPGIEQNLLTHHLNSAQVENQFGDEIVDPAILYKQLKSLGNDRLQMLAKDSPELAKIKLKELGQAAQPLDKVKQFMNNYKLNGQSLTRMANPHTGFAQVANENAKDVLKYGGNVVKDLANFKWGDAATKIGEGAVAYRAAKTLSDPETLKKVAQLRKKYENMSGNTKITGHDIAGPIRRAAVIMGSGVGS